MKRGRFCLAVCACLLLASVSAVAQDVPAPVGPPASVPGIQRSVAGLRLEDFKRAQPSGRAGRRSARTPSDPSRFEAKVAGAVVGAIGGFFAGGILGSRLEPDCHCSDPGMTGLVLGAPIGAVAGGIAGALLARR